MKRHHLGIGSTYVVSAVLLVGAIAGVASYHSSMAAARQQHLHHLGREAEIAVQNLIDESYYSVFSRVNSPRNSLRSKPDIYAGLRDLPFGTPLQFDIEPRFTGRTIKRDGIEIEPVKARITVQRFEDAAPGQPVTSLARFLDPAVLPQLTPTQARGGATSLPAGTSGQVCFTGPGPPPVLQRSVGKGSLELIASASARGGSGLTVSRERKVTFPFVAVLSSTRPPTLYVRMIPIQDSGTMDRKLEHETR